MGQLSRLAFASENISLKIPSIEKPAVCGGEKNLLSCILNNFYYYTLYTIIIWILVLDYLVIFNIIYAHAINLFSNLIQAKLSLSVSCIISGPWRNYFCVICQEIERLKSFIKMAIVYVFYIIQWSRLYSTIPRFFKEFKSGCVMFVVSYMSLLQILFHSGELWLLSNYMKS